MIIGYMSFDFVCMTVNLEFSNDLASNLSPLNVTYCTYMSA